VWMRLLNQLPKSVLWLKRPPAEAQVCLEREAAACGIDPARLVYAENAPLDEHIARHTLADLFLDTLPYNAHATAADALGAGLPLLTCKGAAFAGRVAASLLEAAGLPELVSESLEAYEARALELARDPAQLGTLKKKLLQSLPNAPLFDADCFRRNIEAAYVIMSEQRGNPRSFSVAG
jgi:protein O-GlcNAc transferase